MAFEIFLKGNENVGLFNIVLFYVVYKQEEEKMMWLIVHCCSYTIALQSFTSLYESHINQNNSAKLITDDRGYFNCVNNISVIF